MEVQVSHRVCTEILPDNWELVSKTHDSGQITQNTVSVFTNEYFPVLPTGIRRSFFWGLLIIPLMIIFIIRKRIIPR